MPVTRRIVAGIVVGLWAATAVALPATAHDELVTSSPEADEQFDTAPDAVTLTFSDEPLSLDGAGVAVVVTDGAGRDWLAGSPEVSERTVTAPLLDDMPDAGYEVRWRVVSSDGHPISGVLPFTVGDAVPLAESAPASPTNETGRGSDVGLSGDQVQEKNAYESQQALRVVLLSAGGAVFALAVYALIIFFRRRMRGSTKGTRP